MKMNVGYLLENAASRYPKKLALVYEGKEYTYGEYNQRVNRLSNFLRAQGIGKGEKVATLMNNSNFQVEIYLACAKIGAVFTPLNYRQKERELEYVIQHSEARTLFFFPEFSTEADYLKNRCPITRMVQVGGGLVPAALDYEDVLRSSSDEEPGLPITITEVDPCQLLYTSGTTGRPKGVILSHGNVLWNVINSIFIRGDRNEDRFLLVGPLYHVAGLNSHFTTKIAVGATVVIMKSFKAQEMMELIESYKITMVSGAPSLYHILFQLPELESYDTRSVRSCSVGASICPQETKYRLTKLFRHASGVFDVYGATEATCNISILPAVDWERKPGSVGKGLLFTRLRIVDRIGADVPTGSIGEIICCGPNIMERYYKDEEATCEALRGGWLHTGDLGKMDGEGYLYIVGRLKDTIISGGENIYPREVEEILYTHPKIQEAAVIGVPDPKWGETVKAVVVLSPGQMATEEEIIFYCKQKIAPYKAPKLVDFVSELPKTASGKIDKKILR